MSELDAALILASAIAGGASAPDGESAGSAGRNDLQAQKAKQDAALVPELVLLHLIAISTANLGDMFGRKGESLPLTAWPEWLRVGVRTWKVGIRRRGGGVVEQTLTVAFHDVFKALKLLGKRHGMWKRRKKQDEGPQCDDQVLEILHRPVQRNWERKRLDEADVEEARKIVAGRAAGEWPAGGRVKPEDEAILRRAEQVVVEAERNGGGAD